MQAVSTTYKEQRNNMLRNYTYMKVNLGIVDPDASDNNTITDNGNMFYSDTSETYLGKVVETRYMTMEHNRFILDGNGLLPPEIGGDTPYYQGYVSSVISNASGTFTSNPIITIDFGMDFKFSGLTFRFDKILGCYPSEMIVRAYLNGTQVYTSTQYPHENYTRSYECKPKYNGKRKITIEKRRLS